MLLLLGLLRLISHLLLLLLTCTCLCQCLSLRIVISLCLCLQLVISCCIATTLVSVVEGVVGTAVEEEVLIALVSRMVP